MIRHLLRTLTLAAVATVFVAPPAQAQAQPAARTVTKESAGTVGANAAPTKSALPSEVTIQREVFDYNGGGRRDPYKSLMSSSDVRPLLSDLRVTGIAVDPVGDNSVAVLRDTYSKQQYRVRVGQQLGRLRVSAIKEKAVQFTIEEFGFNRTETLRQSSDTTKVRNP